MGGATPNVLPFLPSSPKLWGPPLGTLFLLSSSPKNNKVKRKRRGKNRIFRGQVSSSDLEFWTPKYFFKVFSVLRILVFQQ
ncbi:hypothetical protein HPP92_010712 [Vanilla planifolia]|uniref:Uncharacterized protein n=1 Tax=Vanilla planifolia TaxID=51239 RepID=A0A835RA67_VANPL|nr:hypothetical protein HPP92_010712 [Vanilla planifolia]